MYIKIRGKPLWDARGTPCLGAPCIKLRDGPVVRVRGKPPFKECANTFVRGYKNVPIRGKPPMVINTVISTKERSLSNEVAPENERFLFCFLRSPLGGKPEGKGAFRGKGSVDWLHRQSRVYTAKNSVDFFGVFIPNGEWYAEKEEEAPPNLPKGKGQEKKREESTETLVKRERQDYETQD